MAHLTDIARRHLDARLDQLRNSVAASRPPQKGWIAALRTALGMSQAVLAERMGVSQQTISQLEQRESSGNATLKALQQAADALGGQFVYAIVPAQPLQKTLEARALRLARQMTGSVSHTMRLEDQETDSDLEERTRQLARELMASPGRLWSVSNGG